MPGDPATPVRPADFLAAAEALELGDTERTLKLLQTYGRDDLDARLLRARVLVRQGDTVRALREVESARQAAPADARVHATLAELYCELGRNQAAEDAIRAGLAATGDTPELHRARGVLMLAREGGAARGVEHLQKARSLDPDLPFVERPLAVGLELIGREHLRASRTTEAVRAARAGLELRPDDFDLRRLHADALSAAGALRQAVDVFEELLDDGFDVEDDLAQATWRAGMADLVRGRRGEALERFARARELGMTDDALGAAATILRDEADALTDRGVQAFRAGRTEEARDLFAEALHLDPTHVGAENHLAVAHYQLGMHGLALDGWQRVLGLFDERGTLPPEPVRLNMARAWLAQGRPDEARRAVNAWRARVAELGAEVEPAWEEAADQLLADVERGVVRAAAGDE